jgi:hypothetical protein
MAEEFAFESWVGGETIIDGQNAGSSWDIVQLGGVFLPGVCTVDGLDIGRDIDVQKKKKKEKARLRDNGLSPVTFEIIVELTAKQWPDWLRVRPQIQPKTGGVRTPLQVVHPLVNAHEIDNVYVSRIKIDSPSPRKGMKIIIKVGEWFEEEKESKGPSKKLPASLTPAYARPNYFGDPNQLAKDLQNNAGIMDENAAVNNLYGDQ